MGDREAVAYRGMAAVITGAANGIGLATAAELGRRGARLVLADIEESALRRAEGSLRAGGIDDVFPFRCDVASAESVAALADFAFASLGGVDLLFSNAGVGVSGPVVDMNRTDWDWVMGVNLWGAVHGAKAFLPRMIAQDRPGHIVFNASFSGLVYDAGLGPYCVSKAGVIALAEVLRQELRHTRIGVSVVCPMRVDTEIGSSTRNRAADERAGSVAKDVTDPRDERVPGVILSADDVASRILDAVDHGELYVMTHGDGRPFVAKRFARIDRIYDRQHPGSSR